ncbi:MAG TPA: PAS domain S-box protein, partial [Terracidiphilus sp.]|nr:PAS domain S-box protein [Terracidiphilus sp.]
MTSTAEAATGPRAYFRIQVEAGLRVVAAEGCVRELLGYEAGDFVSPRVLLLDRVHRDDVELAGRLLRGEADTGIHPCNLRVRHADGRMRCLRGEWVRGREAENGKVVELALWGAADAGGSEDPSHGPSIFAAVMESVAEGVFFADTAHVFRHANENFRRYFPDAGGRPRAVTGLTVYDLLPEAEADRQYEIQKAILAGAPAREEVREAPDAAGNARWFYLRNFAVRDEHGEVIGLFGVVRNVTENVLTERELRENRELLKLFIEHAPAALAMLDRNLR